jgi:2-keto-4-pentenoate hydratase/2-oxohepta-3-ene-1,7-dioic acid hydratase in catechol pathway
MLIGRVKHKEKILTVIFDRVKNEVFEIYSEIEEVLEKLDVPMDVSSIGIPIDEVEILIPINPPKIVGIGRNYVGHVKELSSEIPEEPVIFFKPPSSLTKHNSEVIYPPETKRLEYEGELALVMKKRIKNASAEEIQNNPELYYGYTPFLDMTARDIQKTEDVWAKSKGFDTFGPIGPWINIDPLPDSLEIRTFLNDELRQEDNINNMIFKPSFLVEYISKFMTLEVGDVIITGTPEGVGVVNDGDKVKLEISNLENLEVKITK